MTENGRSKNLAVFFDYENFARSADFDLAELLSRLQERGRLVIKRAYADWGRFTNAKQAVIRSAVELIETPSQRSGKNHADIKLVVDALETALTKDYIDTFVIASGDSDFIPLVVKLRELNRYVIVISSEKSGSTLMASYCDELLYYVSPLKKAAASPGSPLKANGYESAAEEQPRASTIAAKSSSAKSNSAKSDSAQSKAPVSRAPLLKMFVWAAHPDLISEQNGLTEPSRWISLSLIGSQLRRLFPTLTMAEFGLPRKGGLARFAKWLQAEGYIEVDTSLTENKQTMFRKTKKWPVLTVDDAPPDAFVEMRLNLLAHPQGYHYDRRLIEFLSDHIGQMIAEFTHNGQELTLLEIMRFAKKTQSHFDGTRVSDKVWQQVFRTLVAAGVLHDGQGTPLPLEYQSAVARGCLSSTEAIARVGEFLRNGSAYQVVNTAPEIF